MKDYAINMKNITKVFPGVIANDNVTLQVKKGEIHALLGENGAGKSVLMSTLFGMYQPEKGTISINGKIVKIENPREANQLGIGMVHQHFKLVNDFSVLENITLGVEDTKNGLISKKDARKKVIALSEQYGLQINVDDKVKNISVGMQQRVEILKMLYRNSDILIFDEPTAVLTPQEIEELMKVIKKLAGEGKSIVLITHKLNEIKAICDRCTIMRKGKYIQTIDVATTSQELLAEMMVGRRINADLPKKNFEPGAEVLTVTNLTLDSKKNGQSELKNLNFNLRAGEILTVAGIDGNGQSELIEVLSGLTKHDNGEIKLKGQSIGDLSIRHRNQAGLTCIPEDRHKHGLVLDYPLLENLIMKKYYRKDFQKYQFIDFEAGKDFSEEMIERYDIRAGNGSETIVRNLSGGNQQKAIIAREVDLNPDVLIAAQPTRGLDVGAIEGIHKELLKQRDKGKSILLISFELEEVFRLSDRILVMYEGEFVGEFLPAEISFEEIGLYMSGAKRREVR